MQHAPATHPRPARDALIGRRVLAFEPFWLLALAPLVLLPGRFVPLRWHWAVVLGLLLFWPIRLWIERRLSLRHPVTIATGIMLLFVLPAVAIAADRARAWEAAGYLLLGIAAGNALLLWPPTQRAPGWITAGVLAVCAGLSLIGPLIVAQVGRVADLLAPIQRAAGPLAALLGETINPNILAHALLMGLPLAAALALTPGWTRGRPWLRWAAGALAVWLLAVILLSQARGALLALLVVLPLLLMLRWPRLFWLAPVLLIGLVAVAYWQGPALLDALTTSSTTNGIRERMEIWQRALYLIADAPFTGMGLAAFGQVVPVLYPYILVTDPGMVPDAHNLILQVAADLGIFGMLAWLAVQVLLLVGLARLLSERRDPLRWALAAGAFGALVAMQLAGLFGAVNWGVKPAFLPWLLAALAILLELQARANSAAGGAPRYTEGIMTPGALHKD